MRVIFPLGGRFYFCLVVIFLCAGFSARAAGHVTTPKEYLGHELGEDYWLANYQQLVAYWAQLAHDSDRLKLVTIGYTEEDRPQLMGIVTSPANQQRLARYQDIARQLAQAGGIDDATARKLADEGKAVVWIDGGLHANEVLGAQQLMETLYQMVSADDAETLRILDNVIILFVHANPDGMDLCSDWYMREEDPKKRTLANLPRLYQKYIGHDDNRDFYAATQAETRNMNRVMYHDWFPQIVYNHHQAGPPGTVIFCPPFRDPFNFDVDPLVISGIDALGAAMMQRFLEEGKPGATSRSGSRYSTWWNGGLRTTCYFHNMIGLLTEAIGNPTPMQIPFTPAQQVPKADYLAPIAPQTWHFRQSVDYSVSANRAVLDYAARHREQLLHNIWLMGHKAIERGNSDSWTITPKLVEVTAEAPEPSSEDSPGSKATARHRGIAGGGVNEFNRLFRDPAHRDARGYVIPADQADFLTATKFVNSLLNVGVTVLRAKSDFDTAGKHYPAGSYVVKCAQAFRAHVMDMFEPQDHPNDFAYPGAAPTPPYDITGWTLAYQMGVKFDRVMDGFDGPFEELKNELPAPPAKVSDTNDAAGFFLGSKANDNYRAVNELLASGEEVRRLREPFVADGVPHRPGMFFVSRRASTLPLLERIADELGTKFVGSQIIPGPEAVAVKPVRIGLWDRYGGSISSGWTRWLLEKFEFPFQVVYTPELNQGGLRAKYDVLLFVDGAIPGFVGSGTNRPSVDIGGDLPPVAHIGSAGPNEDNLPEEYRHRQGNISVKNTMPELRQFLAQGGTILAIGSSTSIGYHLGLPLADRLTAPDKDGNDHSLPREKFYVPGALLRARFDNNQGLTYGMEDYADVMFSSSPAFRLAEGAEAGGVHRIAWYDSKTPLRSGWSWGQENLENGAAIVEARVGAGNLVLFGPEILFRGQSHGTFKLLFNAIVEAGMSRRQEKFNVAGAE